MGRDRLLAIYFPFEEDFEVPDLILRELHEAHAALEKALEDKRRKEVETAAARNVYYHDLFEPDKTLLFELIKKEEEYTATLRHWNECMKKLHGVRCNICTFLFLSVYLYLMLGT